MTKTRDEVKRRCFICGEYGAYSVEAGEQMVILCEEHNRKYDLHTYIGIKPSMGHY